MTAGERRRTDVNGELSKPGECGGVSGMGDVGELGEAVARAARVVRVVPGGPMLVEGPVNAQAPDGTRVCSDRFMVAVCLCRRSKSYPMCDTSHRRKVRPA